MNRENNKPILFKKRAYLRVVFLFLFVAISQSLFAHDIVKDLWNMSAADSALLYLQLGYFHILPLGFDHILFITSLFLLSPTLKSVLWQSLAFTLAHSVTLGLAIYGIVAVPPSIVEPLIALSILFMALENIFVKRIKASRIGLVFLFGLVHGLGFAGALGEIGLPPNAYLLSLLLFNTGVELGQLTIILLAFLLVGKWFGDKSWYHKRIVIPSSVAIGAVALYWFVQRLNF